MRQGGTAEIEIGFYEWKKLKIPTMCCYCSNAKNYDLVALAGGLYSGILLMIVAAVWYFIYMPIFVAAFLVGFVNLGYCLYEWKYLYIWSRDKYMKYHYLLYAVLLGLGLFLTRKVI